jgi:hypothetical protein
MLLLERSPNWRRLLLNPGMLTNWWTHEVSGHFQQFYKDLIDGKRPKLALMAPPQHGKSKAVSDFIAWLAGVNPDLKVIFASYSDELGARANVELQRAIKSDVFRGIFGRTVTGIDNWVCNQSLIEYADYRGSFRNVTIQGGVTGFALDLGVIDDYTKDRAEANRLPPGRGRHQISLQGAGAVSRLQAHRPVAGAQAGDEHRQLGSRVPTESDYCRRRPVAH